MKKSLARTAMKWSSALDAVVPVLAALSPVALSRVRVPGVPTSIFAVLAGAVVAVLAFFLLRFVPGLRANHPLSRAVLLGVLVAEVMIFHASAEMPSATALFLFLFLYFNATDGVTGSARH